MKFRTAQINRLRGLLAEYGEVMRGGLKRDMAAVLERLSERLPAMVIETLREQWARVAALDDEISMIERRLEAWHGDRPVSRRLAAIPGVGLLSATAVVAIMGDQPRSAPAASRRLAGSGGSPQRHGRAGAHAGHLEARRHVPADLVNPRRPHGAHPHEGAAA